MAMVEVQLGDQKPTILGWDFSMKNGAKNGL